MIFKAEFREEIVKAIPCIVECLKNSDTHVCSAAAQGLSLFGAYRMCPSVSLMPLVFCPE